MRYESTALPDAMSVDGIYTVLKVDFSRSGVGIGEAHDFPEISFISRGTHYGIIDGKESKRLCGQLLIIAPGSFHKSARPSDSEALIISFASSSPALNELYNRNLNLTPSQEKAFRSIVSDGLGLFRYRAPGSDVRGMVLRENADKSILHKMKKELELFLIDLHRHFCERGSDTKSSRYDAEFDAVKKFLCAHISEHLTLSEIAEGTNMSVSKLKMLFREKSGGGAINCFIEMKIEKAKEMLKESKYNFTETAETLGFSSIHYFSRLFKKVTGISPSDYVKREKTKIE